MAETSDPTRIFLVADAIGATQLISFLQPFQKRIARGEIAIAFESHATKTPKLLERFDEHRPDVLVMSRYSLGDGAPLVERARAAGAPVVFHIDDDLLNVPVNIGQSKFQAYNRPERLAQLRANIDASDLLYVSTSPLAEIMRGHGVKPPIVAGALYCSVDPDAFPPPLPSATPIIGYMGSEGHAADLETVLPALERLMEETPELRFETYGTIRFPEALRRFGGRVGHHDPVSNYAGFVRKLSSLGWWIGLAPLEQTPFNHCKADTKWVEYSFAGMATVASDGPVYLSACGGGAGLIADDAASWSACLAGLIADKAARDALVGRARARLASGYRHDILERQALQIFDYARELSLAGRQAAPAQISPEKAEPHVDRV